MTAEEKISQLTNQAAAIPRLGVPQYEWWNEALHGVARAGVATVFPQAIGLAATFDAPLVHEMAVVVSDEARAKHHQFVREGRRERYQGLTFWSPNINIFRDPRWGRGQETYGEDPFLTGRLGVEFVKGLQGDDPRYYKVIATAKHYAVHSGPEPDRHTFDARPSERDLHETYLPAFRALVQDGRAASVMSAYNRVNGESATASQRLLDDILRREWGFGGYVVSDCGAVDDIFMRHKIVATAPESLGPRAHARLRPRVRRLVQARSARRSRAGSFEGDGPRPSRSSGSCSPACGSGCSTRRSGSPTRGSRTRSTTRPSTTASRGASRRSRSCS